MTASDHPGITEFRAVDPVNPNDRTKHTYLETPEMIKYLPNMQLQKRDENGKWDTFLLSVADDDEKEVTDQD